MSLGVRDLHERAMYWGELAIVYRKAAPDKFNFYIGHALSLETKAAKLLDPIAEAEPTRGILYLSAASLAQQAGQPDEAKILIEQGLSGHPDERTKQELNQLAVGL